MIGAICLKEIELAKLIPLGLVSTSAGTSVPLIPTASQALYPDGFNSIYINAASGNAGPVYITSDTLAPNTTNFSNILFTLPTSVSSQVISSTGQVNDNGPGGMYLAVPTTGYGLIVTVKRV